MASLPIGSDKILEVHTSSVSIVIKSKKKQAFVDEDSIMSQTSSVDVTAAHLKQIRVDSCKIDNTYEESAASCVNVAVPPLFFEQTDYELVIQSKDGKGVFLHHENAGIREKITPVTDENPGLISGVVNFGSSVGYSDFEIIHDGSTKLIVRIEVFPSKISYKEDYKRMLEDISEEIYSAVIDFMQKTYEWAKIGEREESIPASFFQIISTVFDRYMQAARRVVSSPHHELVTDHRVVPARKAHRTDYLSEKWLAKHPEHVKKTAYGISAHRVMAACKQITYDTTENRFIKLILSSTVKQLKNFKERYCNTVTLADESIAEKADYMIARLKSIMSGSFLEKVGEYQGTESMSLVFGMAPGYRELYKYYLMLKHGLSVNGDVFKISVKDTAQLYEYWCFIKLVSILKRKSYRLFTDDVIKVDKTGVTVALARGQASEVKFINPVTGEKISLIYKPSWESSSAVSPKTDSVLMLEKAGMDKKCKYIFHARYRIEAETDANYYDKSIGPALEDVNTMHRYRDAIVYDGGNEADLISKKELFGAYVLFPYADEEKYKKHRFYKSIDTVNIGGLPFLPGATTLVEKMLKELIANCEELAFESVSLPPQVEKSLSTVNWSEMDVLVGSIGSWAQFKDNIERNYYYVPAKYISEADLPVRYVALYQSANLFKENAGIRYYGLVTQTRRLKRKDINFPVRRNNGDELYYAFRVKCWEALPTAIGVKEEGVFAPKFTSMFLLRNCTQSYELFNIHSGEQYTLLHELKSIFNAAEVNDNGQAEHVYRVASGKTIWVHQGCFDILNENGEGLFEPPLRISDFISHPRSCFALIAERMKGD